MQKTLEVSITGTREEIFQAEIFFKMLRDYTRLGVPFDSAMRQLCSLLEPKPKQTGWWLGQ